MRSYERAGSNNKYHARAVTLDGIRFASQLEANRYLELQLLARAGEIVDLELQPRFPLVVNGVQVATYIADFRYTDPTKNPPVIVEDTKGMKTPVYRIKKKLVKALYGVEIQEVNIRTLRGDK